MRNRQLQLIMHVKYYRHFLKCGPKMWLCLFMVRPITLKPLTRMTLIVTFSVVGDLLMLQTGFNSRLWQVYLSLFLLCFVVCLPVLVHKNCYAFLNFLLHCFLFGILNIQQNLWAIIRILRYRQSIFWMNIWNKAVFLFCMYFLSINACNNILFLLY